MQFIILTHAWRLAFFGEIEPYFNRLFMFRDLLCTVSTVAPYTYSENLRLVVMNSTEMNFISFHTYCTLIQHYNQKKLRYHT